MTFVDDVRSAFDAADFSQTVTAGVGEGRITSGLALRDESAVTAAAAALRHFHILATTPNAPDVIGAYVTYSSGATELFTALRAVSSRRPLAAAALDCITAVVRYSLETERPPEALDAARSVVKEVVKTRAVLIYDVFSHDQRVCAKKALILLRLVAQCHPVLAKEVLNRFNLSSEVMAPALCSEANNYCRVPFLELMFVLMASGGHDVINALSTRGREVLITCLRIIAKRTIDESNAMRSSFVTEREKQDIASKRKARAKSATKVAKHDAQRDAVLPSHVQKMELIAAINFLMAIQRHILGAHNHAMRRAAFAYPMPDIFASIAAADMPSVLVAPTQVTPEHTALRETASSIFIAVATDSRISRVPQIAAALGTVKVTEGTAAVSFVLRVIEQQPQVCKRLLEIGPYLSVMPRLSSTWFGQAAIVSCCVMRLSSATSRFQEKKFFQHCLSHDTALVRHTGLLIMRAFCKVVEADEAASLEPQKFLPPLKVVEDLLRNFGAADEVGQKVLASYQKLFSDDTEETNADLMKLSVEAAGDSLILSEDSIRTALENAPGEALSNIRRKSYLSALVVKAVSSRDTKAAAGLWCLCRDILRCTNLFPAGTEYEIDVYFSVLSTIGEGLEECATGFEKLVFGAVGAPYHLYDEINGDLYCGDSISLMSVASVFRLRKLKALETASTPGRCDWILGEVLLRTLRIIIAAQSLLGQGHHSRYLKKALVSLSNSVDVWWADSNQDAGGKGELVAECRVVQELFLPLVKYPRNAYLKFLQSVSLFRLHNKAPQRLSDVDRAALPYVSFLWHDWQRLRNDDLQSSCYGRNIAESFLLGSLQTNHATSLAASMALLLYADHDKRSKKDVCAGLARLKKNCQEREFALCLAVIVPVVGGRNLRRLLAEAALKVLSQKTTVGSVLNEVLDLLRTAVLRVASFSECWTRHHVDSFLTYGASLLHASGTPSVTAKDAMFSVSLIKALVKHKDLGICFWARKTLQSLSDLRLPISSTNLHMPLTRELAAILPYSPSVHQYIVSQISTWTLSDFEASFLPVLPLLSELFCGKQYVQVKAEHGFVESEIFRLLLEAAGKQDESIFRKLDDDSAFECSEALSNIGRYSAHTFLGFESVLDRLRKAQTDCKGATAETIWLVLRKVFEDPFEKRWREKVSDAVLLKALTALVEWWVLSPLEVENRVHQCALGVMVDVLRNIKERHLNVYALSRDAASLEKSLTAFCSNAMKGLHRSSHCCTASSGAGYAGDVGDQMATVNAILLCVREILLLDLVLDKAAKRTIESLCSHDGGLLLNIVSACRQLDSRGEDSESARTAGSALALLITSALVHLPKYGLEEDVASSLSIAEGVLSTDLVAYNASSDNADCAIFRCMEGISQRMRLHSARQKYELPDRRARFFGPSAAYVITMFGRGRLEKSCEVILTTSQWKNGQPTGSDLSLTALSSAAFDPVYVLQTFLRACGEALQAPGSAVLDIGRIARGGLLSVALVGLSCRDDTIRTLSYACMDLFSKVVGPFRGVPVGSASALYKDRKQLSFLITLLQNSIRNPRERVLPLFAVWFKSALWVALTPSHSAYKAVTYHFLRAPSMDVADCLGVSYLLKCDAIGAELKSARLLALSILREGVTSFSDLVVLRRRNIVDILLVLGGSAFGDDQAIRVDVLNTFAAILARDAELGIAEDLVLLHGIVPWILQNARHAEENEDLLKRRLYVLTRLASALAAKELCDRFAPLLSRALTALMAGVLSVTQSGAQTSTVTKAIDCAAAVCSVHPSTRGLISVDIAMLHLCREAAEGTTVCAESIVAYVVCRQENCAVPLDFCGQLLERSIAGWNDPVETGGCTALNALLRKDGQDVSMIHAYVADGLAAARASGPREERMRPGLYLLLARVMECYPTLWITVASLTAIQMKTDLDDKLMSFSDSLPSSAPPILDLEHDRRFCDTVDLAKPDVMQCLIACASSDTEGF